jgi:prepilin-type N-terminal cleavage/methylation domain-containing protein
MRNQRGFTLIETLIVLVMAIIVAGGLMYMLSGGRRTSRIAELDAQSQQNARVSVDFMIRDLRSIGYGIDYPRGQRGLVYAGPNDVVFNANIRPEPDDANAPGTPTALDVSSSPSTVPPAGTVMYAPSQTFQTGAETVRFTFDSTNDGVVTSDDKNDDTIEQTTNPYDYTLVRQIYGFDGASNGGASEVIALLRGPDAYDDGNYPPPLFTYWYDHDDDTSTPDRLWGDTSGNGELEQGEIAALVAVDNMNIGRINRIRITAIGTSRAPDPRHEGNQGFRETTITSEVTVTRNRPVRAAYIRGVVFNDYNGDGDQDSGEHGLSGVTVRLNTGARKITTASGQYAFRVDPGTYTVTESDPSGYNSTTPNSVVVTATKGAVVMANFGDRAIGGYGTILGGVELWVDGGGGPEPTEDGVPDVEIYLNSGQRDTTDSRGAFSFLVPVSSYTVTMVVPPGFAAVGPLSVDKTLAAEGDTALVVFGLVEAGITGTIEGTVFLDENEDGVLDATEPGIPSVSVMLSNGDSTVTDAGGEYSFTVQAGTYDVMEEDLGGYVSTTVNSVTGVVVAGDSTSIVNFGDILATELSFTVITLGETQRALCITSTDLQEDSKGDQEIILGTKYVAGVTNLNVWFNNWRNLSTPNSAIFDQMPNYSRTPGEDILSIDSGDLNSDGVSDVVTGLTSASGKILVWLTQTSGNNKGKLGDVPENFFFASSLSDIHATVLDHADTDPDLDVILGTEYNYPLGKTEVWFGDGIGNFTHGFDDIYAFAGLHLLHSARSLALANVVNSPARDIIVGTESGIYHGRIEIYRDLGSPNGKFVHYRSMVSDGAVSALVVRDMLEDSEGDNDIITGTVTGAGVGRLDVWHNNGDGTFGELNNLGIRVPSDSVIVNGEILCLGVEQLNNDVYPDIVIGTRRAAAYSGEVQIFQCYGYVPSAPQWVSPDVGEAITLTINDFNEDHKYDLAVGTRTSLSQGHVVVFFND